MFSEALKIMDRNTVHYMIEEQQKELEEQQKKSEEQQRLLSVKDQEIHAKNKTIQAMNQKLDIQQQEIEALKKRVGSSSGAENLEFQIHENTISLSIFQGADQIILRQTLLFHRADMTQMNHTSPCLILSISRQPFIIYFASK